MNAGELRHSITIQANTPSTANDGQKVESWGTYFSCYAAIEPVGGGESYGSQPQVVADVTHTITVRACPETLLVGPRHRVSFADPDTSTTRIFNIGRATPDPRRRMVTLDCTERITGA